MKKGEPGAYDILESLVSQFTEPLCFLRELVQNALDAGTERVEISFELKPAQDEGRGVMIIHVDDYGEGMNREIIDNQLTRLFSSSKEGDLTKIGKFGIGFVSVFAIDPDAVIVDTSRDGENWRIIFSRDRTFERIVRNDPVEGTKIRVIKEVTTAEFEGFLKGGRAVTVKWCKHADAEIYFQGVRVNEPVDIASPCAVRHSEGGTLVVAGYTDRTPPFFGFYNKGLTLLEGTGGIFPDITYKISSRYLEHTLTRDRILQDENYEKAMAILARVAHDMLPAALFERLADASRRGFSSPADALLLRAAFPRLREPASLPQALRKTPFIPAMEDRLLSLADCEKLKGRQERFYWDTEENAVTRELAAKSVTVFRCERESPLLPLLESLLAARGLRAFFTFFRPLIVEETDLPEAHRSLIAHMKGLAPLYDSRIAAVQLGDFAYPGSPRVDELSVLLDTSGSTKKDESFTLVVNRGHPHAAKLLEAAQYAPILISYLLVKLVALEGREEGIDPQLDGRLAAWCVAREAP